MRRRVRLPTTPSGVAVLRRVAACGGLLAGLACGTDPPRDSADASGSVDAHGPGAAGDAAFDGAAGDALGGDGASGEGGPEGSGDGGPSGTPTAMTPVKLAPFVGLRSASAAAASSAGFHGADLGWFFQHGTDLRVLFGDSWADTYATPIGTVGDDAEGIVSLLQFPDGDAVEALLNPTFPWWQNAAPPPTLVTNPSSKVAGITLYRGGMTDGGAPLPMGLGRVPAAGFSNAGAAHPENAAFGLFSRIEAVPCAGGDAGAPACSEGFACDPGLGLCSGATSLPPFPCVLGSNDCTAGDTCDAVPGGGLCQDRTSSVYAASSDFGRIEAVVVRHEVGNADPAHPEVFYTQSWETNRFLNPSVRTVEDFDPQRTDPRQNDYLPADGSHPASEKVFLWGRPNFLGVGKEHLDARLYFAFVDMPAYSATGAFAWKPQYFTGLAAGKPVFSPNPTDAAALDLHGGAGDPSETWDYVEQMSISYVAPLQRWMMLYGGAAPFAAVPPAPQGTTSYSSSNEAVGDPEGAIHVRFATNPWGPWSEPAQLLVAGDPTASPPTLEYADDGMLHDTTCSAAHCAPGEKALAYVVTPWGWLYGPSIVDPWTTARGGGSADVYFTVSTWDPYGTVLLKTRVVP